MCRWMAYSGAPVAIDELLFKPSHSLVDQSLSARLSEEPTNADGFGIGWYGRSNNPARYRSTQPAWNDANLRDLSAEVVSGLFVAHVRRSTGSPVQNSNCHPFSHDNWLFVHNGELRDFAVYRHQLAVAIAPEIFARLQGSTDSELMFALALTFGLAQSPIAALEQMVAFIEQTAASQGVDDPVQMTLGLMDGERLYGVRYSTASQPRTLFHSLDVASIAELQGDAAGVSRFGSEARVLTSEPIGDLPGAWQPVDAASVVVIDGADLDYRPFKPRLP